MDIDTSFDFTADVPCYWDTFWQNKGGRGGGNADSDPDAVSPMLQKYHQTLWSKELPCGEKMKLVPLTLRFKNGGNSLALRWKDYIFTSDSISVGHRYVRMTKILEDFKKVEPDYKAYVENFVRKSYTIGGMMIWPCREKSINQTKGRNWDISDRIDRTLECIRRFYLGEENPMNECLEQDRRFFELFVNFRGFVDFFFFQDLVSDDYKSVRMMIGTKKLSTPALAQSVDEYRLWLERQLDFVHRRNSRIKEAMAS